MTILFLSHFFYPHIGGVEKHVMEISNLLIKKGHKVSIIAEDEDENLSQNIPNDHRLNNKKIKDINVYKIDTGRDDWLKKFRIWKQMWGLRKIIRNADIVHCHDVFYWYLPFRFLFPTKPVYTTFHGYESYPIKKKAVIMRKISEKLSKGNICIGDFIKKWYGTTPTMITYGGVTIRTNNKVFRTKDFLKNKSAVFFGRLDEQTGLGTYVKAFGILKKRYPEFEFLVIGDGPDKKLLDNRINSIGFQENPEKYFAQYRFAFISRYLSILEAFAEKRLVFAVYDNPVKEDYLRMSPFADFIIIENTSEKLAEKVIFYLNHPDKEQQRINKAFAWVKQQSWGNVVNTYLKLWS